MTQNFLSTKQYRENVKKLNPLEASIWRKMISKKGVVFLQGAPGGGKTSVLYSIANKLGIDFVHLNLATSDETDFQYPLINKRVQDDYEYDVIRFGVPEWALEANERPTIIIFEELNRAPQNVRNAALQPLQERSIGYRFKFNDNVFMAASGNLGEDDGTDVDELDNAMTGRLIIVPYEINYDKWMYWAEGRIHPDILSFLRISPDYLYKPSGNNSGEIASYASPRTWENLSAFIYHNVGGGYKYDENNNPIVDENNDELHFPDGGKLIPLKTDDGKEIMKFERNWGSYKDYSQLIREDGVYFIGPTINKFIIYMDNKIKYNKDDILNSFQTIAHDVKDIPHKEILDSLAVINYDELSNKQLHNLIDYSHVLSSELLFSFITDIIDNIGQGKNPTPSKKDSVNLLKFFGANKEIIQKVKQATESNKKMR